MLAGMDEQFRKDREENRRLVRDTQCLLDTLAVRMNELTLKIGDTNDATARFAEESRAADLLLGARIEALVRAIDAWLTEKRQPLEAAIEALRNAINRV